MKYFKILTLLLFSSVISFYGCNDNSKTPTQETKKTQPQPLEVFDANNQPNAKNSNQSLEPAQNTQGVWHYTCSNGCAGGAGSASACNSCGNTLVHNQGYHSNANANNPTTTPTPEPSQNAAGVWHYTCSNGCAGGAGSAKACNSCGNTLAHNTAYH